MAAPAITAAAPLQPMGRVSGLGTEDGCMPVSMGRGHARHKRHDRGCSSSASRPTGPGFKERTGALSLTPGDLAAEGLTTSRQAGVETSAPSPDPTGQKQAGNNEREENASERQKSPVGLTIVT
jgi:hypothetical protein